MGLQAERRRSGKVREVYETNFFGPVALIQAMLPLLRKSRHGRIVNVSSSLGSLTLSSDLTSPFADFLALGYNTSKSALNAMTIQFAKELKDTAIKVNAICPGYCATDINGNSGPRSAEQGAAAAIQYATSATTDQPADISTMRDEFPGKISPRGAGSRAPRLPPAPSAWPTQSADALATPARSPCPRSRFRGPPDRHKAAMRSATSSGCSTTLLAWLTTPGIRILPSGSFTSFQTFHSCSWRGLAASTE